MAQHDPTSVPDAREHPPIAEANTEPAPGGCPVAHGRLKPPTQGGGNRD